MIFFVCVWHEGRSQDSFTFTSGQPVDPFTEQTFFSLQCLFCHKLVTTYTWAYFQISFCPLRLYLTFFFFFFYYSCIVILAMCQYKSSKFSFSFSRLYLVILGLLHVHVNFRISVSISTRTKPFQILIGITQKLKENFFVVKF